MTDPDRAIDVIRNMTFNFKVHQILVHRLRIVNLLTDWNSVILSGALTFPCVISFLSLFHRHSGQLCLLQPLTL